MITEKLASRHLLKNKSTSLITILGITISVAMMTALLLFSTAFLNLMSESRAEVDGAWHFLLTNASEEEVETLAQRADIEKLERLNVLGMADEFADNGRYFSVLYQLPEDPEFIGLQLAKGRMPENDQEILIPTNYYTPDLERVKIGDKLELPWGCLEREGKPLAYYFRTHIGDEEDLLFRQEWKREFTVVGVHALGGGHSVAPGLQAFYTANSPPAIAINLAFRVKNLDASQVKAWQESEYGERIHSNRSLLELVPGVEGFTSQIVLKSFVVVFVLIIGVAGIGMIYNAFSISLSRRSQSLAMLSSIGLTRRQKWQMVLWEGLILLIIALPLGILTGYLGISVVCRVLENPMQDLLHTEGVLRPVWNYGILLRIIGLSVLTVILSAIIPAIRSSRFSPIAGLNEEGERVLNERTVRTSPLWGRVLGFAGEMGVKNMKRSRRRSRAMTIALILSLILFNSVLYLSHMMERTIDLKADQGLADFEFGSIETPGDEMVRELREIPEVKSFYLNKRTNLYLKQTEELNPDLFFNEAIPAGGEEPAIQKAHEIPCTLVALPPQEMAEYLSRVGVPSLTDREVIMINTLNVFSEQEGKYNEIIQVATKLPEEIELVSSNREKTVTLKPVALTDVNIPEFADWSGAPVLVCTEKLASELTDESWFTKANIYAREGKTEVLSEKLHELIDEYQIDFYLYDKAYENRSTRNGILVMQVLFIGFVTLIALISFFNILNTILNSFSMRKKEFAVLRSTGMQEKQFSRMVLSEGLIYGGKILFWGFLLSCLLAYAIHRYLTQTTAFPFTLPWWIFLASGVVLVILVQLMMQFGFRRANEGDLVETLRKSSEN